MGEQESGVDLKYQHSTISIHIHQLLSIHIGDSRMFGVDMPLPMGVDIGKPLLSDYDNDAKPMQLRKRIRRQHRTIQLLLKSVLSSP